ncbi:unnamed protein product [Protopolystoma xenopodis]|uniref:Cation efflux protein cytoplasmic domain-containing protein n=1 Tax=Protopolystoma xenopodis TaxID=117903 RepID=A0A3S5AFG9_9PLAT|nr:unnamed protein product [Protopolystoma xenopodis]
MKIADPICTFLFSVLVLLTTINILRDAMNVLMEGTPRGLEFNEVRASLYSLDGVVEVHNLRIWSLTMNKTAISVHLAVGELVLLIHMDINRFASYFTWFSFGGRDLPVQLQRSLRFVLNNEIST